MYVYIPVGQEATREPAHAVPLEDASEFLRPEERERVRRQRGDERQRGDLRVWGGEERFREERGRG
jgi:hypothetical protein